MKDCRFQQIYVVCVRIKNQYDKNWLAMWRLRLSVLRFLDSSNFYTPCGNTHQDVAILPQLLITERVALKKVLLLFFVGKIATAVFSFFLPHFLYIACLRDP